MNLGHIGLEHSLRRIAWAYGCCKKGSDEEARLRELLLRKAASLDPGPKYTDPATEEPQP